MFSIFGKSNKDKQPTLAEGLAALERCGIRKRDDVSIDDVLYSTGGTLNDPINYASYFALLEAR